MSPRSRFLNTANCRVKVFETEMATMTMAVLPTQQQNQQGTGRSDSVESGSSRPNFDPATCYQLAQGWITLCGCGSMWFDVLSLVGQSC